MSTAPDTDNAVLPFARGLADSDATMALGAQLAAVLRSGDCLTLHGDLGAGKTTLARGLIKAWAPDTAEVPSPTFTLVQEYDGRGDSRLLHYDLYRLEHPDEVWELEWDGLGTAVSLIEWPDRAGPHLPGNRLQVHLSFDGSARSAAFACDRRFADLWTDRLHGI